jgi:hypothetical protein
MKCHWSPSIQTLKLNDFIARKLSRPSSKTFHSFSRLWKLRLMIKWRKKIKMKSCYIFIFTSFYAVRNWNKNASEKVTFGVIKCEAQVKWKSQKHKNLLLMIIAMMLMMHLCNEKRAERLLLWALSALFVSLGIF